MISPQELQNHKFEKAVFGGYDMAGVDEFLDQLIPDYAALYKENMTLKNKMKVLVDKIEEYRSVDDEMRKALYSAQVTSKEISQKAQNEAKQILAQAQAESAQMLATARAETEGKIVDMQAQIRAESKRLEDAKSASDQYASAMIEILKKNIAVIEAIAQKNVTDFVQPPCAPQESAQEPVRPEAAQTEQAEPAPQPEEMEATKIFNPGADDEDTARIFSSVSEAAPGHTKFENLKFGKEYHAEEEQ
ncbi:DivIVA domain-containing protein [Acidaminobacterium chupaoyuni]